MWRTLIKIIGFGLLFAILIPNIVHTLSWETVGIAILFVVAGFLLGRYTCSLHSRGAGLWATLGVFAVLNLLHSTVDGVAATIVPFTQNLQIIGLHELLRQPALYVIAAGMMTPFVASRVRVWGITFVLVTGIWALGAGLGWWFAEYIQVFEGVHEILELTLFIFMGDIIHHVWDEWRHGRGHDHSGH